MKPLITILLIAMGTFMSNAQEIDKVELQMAIERQLVAYPQSTLQDVYKAFYQEHFGPEHMISDTAAVRNYLDYELSTMGDERGSLYYEPIGLNGDYVRVYLKAVKDSLITADELLQAFIDSANAQRERQVEWSVLWHAIVNVIKDMNLGLAHFDEDMPVLQQASERNQAVHHSRAYNEAYHPHYRIVDRHIFELLLMPLMK